MSVDISALEYKEIYGCVLAMNHFPFV